MATVLVCLCLALGSGAAAFDVGTELIRLEHDYVSVSLAVPKIRGLDDWLFEEYLNTAWRLEHLDYARRIQDAALEARNEPSIPGHFFPYVCHTEFEVKHAEGGILSLVTLFYGYTGGAHGLTVQKAVNYDLHSRRQLTLKDVVQHPDAVQIILEEVNHQIAADPQFYFPDVLPVSHLNEQDFYLTEAGLVVFYQLYDIAPYAAGIREFTIPWQLFEGAELMMP